MKKYIIALMLVFIFLTIGWAQEIVYTNQTTIAWDAVTKLSDGSVIPVEDTITYEVYRGDVLFGETSGLEYTITFIEEGEYRVGVRTKRLVASTGDTVYSDMNWSDINGLETPDPFVVRFIVPVAEPRNLRLK